MPHWLGEVLSAIRAHTRAGSVRFTYKALLALAELEPAPTPDDVVHILAGLQPAAFRMRVRSVRTGRWLYVFRAEWCGERIYLKLQLRPECVLVSFHQEESDYGPEEDEV